MERCFPLEDKLVVSSGSHIPAEMEDEYGETIFLEPKVQPKELAIETCKKLSTHAIVSLAKVLKSS